MIILSSDKKKTIENEINTNQAQAVGDTVQDAMNTIVLSKKLHVHHPVWKFHILLHLY